MSFVSCLTTGREHLKGTGLRREHAATTSMLPYERLALAPKLFHRVHALTQQSRGGTYRSGTPSSPTGIMCMIAMAASRLVLWRDGSDLGRQRR